MKVNYWKNAVILLSAVAILAACKNENQPEKINPPTKAAFNNLKNKALADITQTKTFKAEESIVFNSAKGAVLTIPPNCLYDENNTRVTGNVELSFIEIYDKGNMVVTNKPVMGLDKATGNPRPLITGGQFNIEIKQGDKKLRSACYYDLFVPGSPTGNIDPRMTLWEGSIDAESGNIVFDQPEGREGGVKASDTDYGIFGNRFDWINIDIFYSYEGPKAKIKVKVPDGYDNTNADLFIAIGGERNLLAQLYYYDATEKYFSEHYGLPVGKEIHLIFVSESNGSVVYAIKDVTIAADQTIIIDSSELKVATLEEAIAVINALG